MLPSVRPDHSQTAACSPGEGNLESPSLNLDLRCSDLTVCVWILFFCSADEESGGEATVGALPQEADRRKPSRITPTQGKQVHMSWSSCVKLPRSPHHPKTLTLDADSYLPTGEVQHRSLWFEAYCCSQEIRLLSRPGCGGFTASVSS